MTINRKVKILYLLSDKKYQIQTKFKDTDWKLFILSINTYTNSFFEVDMNNNVC